MISDQIGVEVGRIKLYSTPDFKADINLSFSVAKSKLTDESIIYVQVTGELPDVPFAQMAMPIDVQEKFLEHGQKIPIHIQKIRSLYGTRAITGALFEHRESLLPHVDFQKESSTFAIRIGFEALKRFQSHAIQSGFKNHRILFLYGTINKITGKVTVQASSEPEQNNFSDHVEISEQYNPISAILLARGFGMECVGMAISHSGSDPKHPMTEYMVKMAAQYQNMFSEYFTTLIITPEMVNGDVATQIVAFQASDAAMKMDQQLLFDQSDNAGEIHVNQDVIVCGAKKRKVDTNLIICAVRVRQTHSRFVSHAFPWPSQNPTTLDLKKYLGDNEYCPHWYQLFDFNLLIHLANFGVFDPENEGADLVNKILNKEEIPPTIIRRMNELSNN